MQQGQHRVGLARDIQRSYESILAAGRQDDRLILSAALETS